MDELESGMLFIKGSQDEICEIEKTELYAKLRSHGIKTVEYIRIRKGKDDRQALMWIEARTTFPNPKIEHDFVGEIDEISKKFAHSIELFAAVMMNKLPDNKSELKKFRLVYMEAKFQMILVIKGHKKEWLPIVADSLHKKLKQQWKIWNIDPSRDILVFNEQLAKEYKLIY